MLTGFLNLNINEAIIGGNAKGMSHVNDGSFSATSGTAGEDNLNSHNFITILSAILSGLNNTMTEAGNLNSSRFQMLIGEGHTDNDAKFKSLVDSLSLTGGSGMASAENIINENIMRLLQKYVFMPKVCHSSESWNPEVVDFKGTGFPIKFGNDIFRLLQEPLINENIMNVLNQALSGIRLSGAAQAVNTVVGMDGQNSANNSNAMSNAIDKQLLQVKAATVHDTGKAQSEGNLVVDAVAKDEPAPIMLRAMELKHKHTGPEYGHQQGYQRNGAEGMQSLIRGSESADKGVGVLNSIYQPANSQDAAAKESMHVAKLHEIGNSFIKTLNSGSRHLIINLEPPNLGSIQIKLKMTNGVLTANLKVESLAVKELFSSALPQIRASLADSGIKISDFFVDVKKEDNYYDSMKQHRDGSQHDNQRHKKYQEFKFDYFA